MDRVEDAAALAVEVAVVYCPRPGSADLCELRMPRGATVHDALLASGLLDRHCEIAQERLAIGIWGRRCDGTQALNDGDRVEVYRALQVDPKEARRRRHDAQRVRGKKR